MTRATTAAALAVLVMLGVNLKARLSTSTPRYDPEDETAYFRTESALQYRYARMVAAGQGIPELDRAAQWPEGLRPRRELTSVMERLTGRSYRTFAPRGMDFRWFVILWVSVVSSLSILALYLCAASLGASPAAAVLAAAAYGLSWAAQSNVIAAYRLETLGLPLMFASLACAGRLLDERVRRPHAWGAASAALLLAAFASWHLSRFYLVTYLLALAVAYWRRPDRRLLWAAGYGAAAGVLALLMVPSARESLFIASPAAYGHVYGLVGAKLRHLLRHPADPALLSPIQRLEWTGPSNSPDPGFLLFAFLPLAFVLGPRIWARLRDERSEVPIFSYVCDHLFWIYVLGTLLASRLTPWLAFFLVLFAVKKPKPLLFAAVAVLEGLKCLSPASAFNPFLMVSVPFSSHQLRPSVSLDEEKQLLGWLRRYGGPERPVVAPMGLSAELLTYAGTPIVLQPKWEAAAIREKTAEHARRLFEDEASFVEFCRRQQAKLVVYGADHILDETPEGLRYASGRLEVRDDSAAYLMHFFPERLAHLRLVFQNQAFRVFSLEPNKKEAYPKLAVYDRGQYGVKLDAASVLRRMDQARLKLTLARAFARMGRGEEALFTYDEAFAAWPPDDALRKEYDQLRWALSRSSAR